MAGEGKRVVSAKELLAQRNVLVALSRALSADTAGGVLGVAVDVLSRTMAFEGVLAYRVDGTELELVVEQGVPRKAKGWLTRLDLSDAEPWFVAQRVAQTVKSEVDERLAKQRAGVSIAPALREAGWAAVAAVPVAIGRELFGVLVAASKSSTAFDRETMRVLEAAGGVLALAHGRRSDGDREGERLEQTATVELATVGLMAAGVAEDLAGPLETLRLQLDFQESLLRSLRARIGEEMHELDELGELIFEVGAGVRRIGDIAGRLRMSSARPEPVTLDFAQILRAAVAQMQGHIAAQDIVLELVGHQQEMPVDGREPELRLLVLQLLLQAIEQCVRGQDVDSRHILVTLRREAARCVVSVDVTGRPPGAKKSGSEIFDALFARGRASQMGRMSMSLAKQTVLAHNGHIEVAPSTLGGTQVSVMLPISASSIDPQARESMAVPTLRPLESRDPVVLWVDDDPVMARSMKRFLRHYDVRVAATIAEARVLLAELTSVPAGVFCLVELVDGSTVELHRDVAQSIAERFVFMSSGVIPAAIASYLLESGCPTLIKPITLEEIIDMLEGGADDTGRPSAPTLDPTSVG